MTKRSECLPRERMLPSPTVSAFFTSNPKYSFIMVKVFALPTTCTEGYSLMNARIFAE